MTVGAVAKRLRVSSLSVQRWIKKGLLKSYRGTGEKGRIGWKYVTEEALQEYLRRYNPTV